MYKKINLFLATLIFFGLQAQAQVKDTVVSFRQSFIGHTQAIETICFSQDGKLVASGGWDNSIRLYSTDSADYGKFLRSFGGNFGAITALSINKDKTMLVSGAKDFSVRVYDLNTGKVLFISRDHKDAVSSVFFDDSSKFVFSTSVDGTLRVYDCKNFENNKVPRVLNYGTKINQAMLSSAKSSFWIASQKSSIEQVTLTNKVTKTLNGHTAQVNCLAMSTNKKFLATGSDDKTIIIWDLATGTIYKKLVGHGWKVTSVQFSKDGRYLVSSCNNGEVKVWDVNAGTLFSNLPSQGTNARHVEISENQKQIAVATLQPYAPFGPCMYTTPVSMHPIDKVAEKAKALEAKKAKAAEQKKTKANSVNKAK